MQLQSNPYILWQLIPAFITLGIGLYIQSRPIKKRETNVFSITMFGGSLWAFANAIQLVTPDPGWQKTWNNILYLGVMSIPTAWFLLSVKLTGFAQARIEKIEKGMWVVPALLYLFLLTTDVHRLFFSSKNLIEAGGFLSLETLYGPLFLVHTGYSYLLLIAGILILGISLATNFQQYGVQGYGLIIGVLAPMVGNAIYLSGIFPPGFPDPTPIFFTVTGLAFAWAIFGGRMLEVVPLAHDAIVQKLSTGIVILDLQKYIRDINPTAIHMLGLPTNFNRSVAFPELLKGNPAVAESIIPALEVIGKDFQEMQVSSPETGQIFDVLISRVEDNLGKATGWLIQFSDISEKKQVEDNLKSARQTLREILNTLQDSYFEADPDGVITYANKALIKNLGFTRWEEVQGKNFRYFTDRKAIRGIAEKFKILYETKQPLEPFEYNYRTKDGRVYIGETTVSPVIQGDTVVGTRGLIRDITDRVKAEREIIKQKDLLDSLLQQSPIAMVINDMDSKITMINPAFEALFGYSQEEVIGKRLDDILSTPDIVEEIRELTALGMGEGITRVGIRKRKDGTVVDVEMFAAPFFVGGERFGYLVFYNDISERLKAEAEREKIQVTYRAVLESLQDPFFEADKEGILTYVNQAFVEAVRASSKEGLIGKHFRHVTSRKAIRSVFENFMKVYETNRAISPFEFIYRTSDGEDLTSEIVVSPILESGIAVGTRGIVRDISVRVRAEELLREAKEAAEHRAGELAAINRVTTTVSHSLDLSDILQSVCKELTSIYPVRNAGIGLLTPDREALEIAAFHTNYPDETSALGMVLPLDGNAASKEAIEQKKTIVIQDAQNDPRTSSVADVYKERGTKAIMIVPLLTRGEAIGSFGLPAKDPDYIFSQSEIELAETIASQIAAAVDNSKLHAKTEMALDVVARDLEIGREIQASFFPEKLPQIPGWEIATRFQAARQVAGDFYDVFQFRDSKFTTLVIADVCDKGVGAALFMVLFRSLLRAFSETPIRQENLQEQLLKIILNTNNFIAEQHSRSNMFATLFFGILDPDNGVFHYINGGHEPPIVLAQDGTILKRLMPTGPAVGLFPNMPFQVDCVQFNQGDFLVGFTDGTTDAKNIFGELFSEERLLESLAVPWPSVFTTLFELNSRLQKHIGEQAQFDDITLIALKRNPTPHAPQHAIYRNAKIEHLGDLRDFVEQVALYSGLKSDDVFAFKLAVEELCTNIIQYGYQDRKPGNVCLSFCVEDDKASLTIQDDGQYFSPNQANTPDTEAAWDERQIGGLGIYFVNELMDQVTYNKIDEHTNQFTLIKELASSH